MAILCQDEGKIAKCSKCRSREFYEKPINSYINEKPGIYKKYKKAISLICTSCEEEVIQINLDENKIIEE